MRSITIQQQDSKLCETQIEQIMEILANDNEHTEFIRTGLRTFVYSVLDEKQNKLYVEISIKITNDKRNDRYFDLHAEVERYERYQREKSEIEHAKLTMREYKKNRDKVNKKRFSHF